MSSDDTDCRPASSRGRMSRSTSLLATTGSCSAESSSSKSTQRCGGPTGYCSADRLSLLVTGRGSTEPDPDDPPLETLPPTRLIEGSTFLLVGGSTTTTSSPSGSAAADSGRGATDCAIGRAIGVAGPDRLARGTAATGAAAVGATSPTTVSRLGGGGPPVVFFFFLFGCSEGSAAGRLANIPITCSRLNMVPANRK